MLFNKHAVHELDQDAIYNRKIDVDLHHERLNAIKKRKNIYEADLALIQQYFKNFKKFKSQSGFGILKEKVIKKDNKYLAERLNKIKSKPTDTTDGSKLISFINTRNKFFHSYRMLQKKKIDEENAFIRNRLVKQNAEIDSKKIREEFEEHRKLYFKLRRIKPAPNTKNYTSFYEESVNKNNKSTSAGKYSNPKIDYNMCNSVRRNNSMALLPNIYQ